MKLAFRIAIVVALVGTPASSQTIQPSPYNVVEGWLKPFADAGFAFGGNSGVVAESPDRILIIQRGETRLPQPVPAAFTSYAGSFGMNVLFEPEGRTWQNCIFVVDGEGNVKEVWDQWDHLFEGSDGPGPHRIRISPHDPERRVWVVHETAHQIFVFSNDGRELLMTLGERNVAGEDENHFGKPQDVAFWPDGRILVADGFDNGRVVILDKEGRYLSEFGERGDGPGEFNVVHSLAVGPDGRLFVADRDNRRIQVFQESGDGFDYVDAWTGFGLTLDLIVSGDALWVSYLTPPKVTKVDFDGNWLYTWQLPTEGPNRFLEMHSFAVDSDGNLYGSDNQNGRTQKLVPKEGAPPDRLIHP